MGDWSDNGSYKVRYGKDGGGDTFAGRDGGWLLFIIDERGKGRTEKSGKEECRDKDNGNNYEHALCKMVNNENIRKGRVYL